MPARSVENMMPDPTLYLLRHGETEFNVAGRYQGQRASLLTGRGADRARAGCA